MWKNNLPKDFNWFTYLKLNPDLKNSGITTKKKCEEHFLRHGKNENRFYNENKGVLPKDFDWEFYLNNNNDLIKSGLKNESDAIRHYINSGCKENRKYKNCGDKTTEYIYFCKVI